MRTFMQEPATPSPWPFEDPPNVACFTVRSIVEGTRPILRVSHDAEDGTWQILTGETVDMADAMLVGLKSLVDRDKTLLQLADLPLGWSAWRERPGSPWVYGDDAEG